MEDYLKKGHLFDPDLYANAFEPKPKNKSLTFLDKTDGTLLFMTMAVTTTSRYEMPIVSPYTLALPQDIQGYHRLSTSSHRGIAPHFFLSDEKIKTYFSHPFRTEQVLSHFDCSIGIDFSMTKEMCHPQKINSSFLNKLWAAWLQSRGHNVIPNVSFPSEIYEDYWLEGWPKHSVIAVSSVGVPTHGDYEIWLAGMERIWKELAPLHVLRYGPVIPGEKTEKCTYFANDNNRVVRYGG